MNQQTKPFKSGFIAILGRPNAGKSTLMNSLVGQKIAIMSDKPQTTRNKILCVVTEPDAQMIFLDTPGIHKPRHKLGEFMVKSAISAIPDVDIVLIVVDVTTKPGPGDDFIIEAVKASHSPVILVLNKIDQIDKQRLLPLMNTYAAKMNFTAIIPVSALRQTHLDVLVEEIKRHLPEGPQYYPEDTLTDQPERVIMAELIREKALLLTRDEIPHAIAVDIEEIREREQGPLYVRAVIYVERDSQKRIVIGSKGQLLKQIGQQARAEIENLLGMSIYLDLWVKVKKDWRNKEGTLQILGYR